MGDIALSSLLSERCSQIIARFAFSVNLKKKSDTAVTLRRSISLIPCITLVFSSTFMMSISVNRCGSLQSPHVLELLNVTR